jgi:ferrous-iron efflux pump FieF
MVFAIGVTIVLLAIQRYVIRHTGSTAIRADALHYATDLLTNGSTIVGLGLIAAFGWVGIDAWLALAIAGYILYGAWQIGREALHALMDHELSTAEREQITRLALAPEAVHGVHGLRTRQSGAIRIIQLHLELDGDLRLSEAHRIADEVDAQIRAAFPGADVLIHQDPVDHDGSTDREREELPYATSGGI